MRLDMRFGIRLGMRLGMCLDSCLGMLSGLRKIRGRHALCGFRRAIGQVLDIRWPCVTDALDICQAFVIH